VFKYKGANVALNLWKSSKTLFDVGSYILIKIKYGLKIIPLISIKLEGGCMTDLVKALVICNKGPGYKIVAHGNF
jgi:hypothetical protein